MIYVKKCDLIVLLSQAEKYRVHHVHVTRHIAKPAKVELGQGLRPSVASVRVAEIEKSFAIVKMLEKLDECSEVDDHHQGVVHSNGAVQRIWLAVAHVSGQNLLH